MSKDNVKETNREMIDKRKSDIIKSLEGFTFYDIFSILVLLMFAILFLMLIILTYNNMKCYNDNQNNVIKDNSTNSVKEITCIANSYYWDTENQEYIETEVFTTPPKCYEVLE